MDNNKKVDKLNDLLTVNYNAEQGYAKACENVEDNHFKRYLTTRSQQRNRFGHEIKEQINALGGTPDKGTSIQGEIHHAWMDIKSAMSSNDKKAMMEECRRGEERSLNKYQEVRQQLDYPAQTNSVLDQHISSIKESLNEADSLTQNYQA